MKKQGIIFDARDRGELPREIDYYGVGQHLYPHKQWRLFGLRSFFGIHKQKDKQK